MRKILIVLFALFFVTATYCQAVEIKIQGKGSAPLTGYDIKAVRNKQDIKMSNKAHNSDIEALQTQQVKEATRQAETRKKEDTRMNAALRQAVVSEAQEKALDNAIKTLINRTLGANAANKPELREAFAEITSQSSTYILDQNYTGEVRDNNYIATVELLVDETEFKSLLSDLGVAINTANVRAQSILIVLDEFFAAPSNLNQNTATKEVITYKYDKNERDVDKEAYKSASSSKGAYASKGAYSGVYGAAGHSSSGGYANKSATSYGKFSEYTNKESEFFQYIKEYAPTNPKAQNQNYTEAALGSAFVDYDIRTINNGVFKSKYFKGKPITSDQLTNSAELASFVAAARNDAKADYFAIGVSYITDNGKNENTGKFMADGNVFINIYSTADSELIAAGSFTETSFGNTPDQARTAVASKIGKELGEELSNKIQNYWKKRQMYGREYIVQITGSFLPVERASMSKAITATEGVKSATLRTSDASKVEYTVNYSGSENAGDAIFMQLYDVNGAKFKNYNFKINGNQIIFYPIK